MAAPRVIAELVKRFGEQLESYISPKYNEAQVRREFIDPFFKALGWDIDNAQGFAEPYKDVIHEDSIKIGSGHKAPDYSFRVGGARKFFLEAKKPSVSLNDAEDAAFQLRRYGWSAKLPVSIATSFRELAVYDCRTRPRASDKPSVSRIMYLTFKQYLDDWRLIADVFSKEAVYKGALDRFAASTKLKKGTAEVDEEFLEEIETWRDTLARHFALRNPRLKQHELNFVVQATIDRIIFLRISEDRGVEPYGQLRDLLKTANIYRGLVTLFKGADEKYNSGLFHFRPEKGRPEVPDVLTPHLNSDDGPLREIISGLYYPESPYEFSVIGADILGQVYEQFLGKVIRLTTSHRAVIDEKPEVKKAGGVYYTPTYIVDYIVGQTLGAWLKDKTISQAAQLRVLDPACGSGSFLIAAYQYLLDWYLQKYGAQRSAPKRAIYRGGKGQWRLTSGERKRILLAHIYGVDVDPQAVEVTKLSLLLKVLEGESADSLKKQLEMFHERALPDLGSNIRCGNSLIGPDFYAYEQYELLEDPERDRINPFDWSEEFRSVMSNGGFDVILGNPPYVNAWVMFESSPEVRNYINSSNVYRSADRHWDMYVLFLEKSLSLLKKNARLSFIIPFSYCLQKYATLSREMIVKGYSIESIADLRKIQVFKNVPVITIIPVISNSRPAAAHKISILGPGAEATRHHPGKIARRHAVAQRVFCHTEEFMWRLDLDSTSLATCRAIDKASIRVRDVAWVNYGAQMSSRRRGAFGKEYVLRDAAETKSCKKTISGRNVHRYEVNWDGRYVEWALAPKMYGPREPWFFETPKLMVRDITGTHRLELCVDATKVYCDHTVLCCLRACDVASYKDFPRETEERSKLYSLELMQGLLASRAVSAYYYWKLTGEGVRTGGGFHTYPSTVRALPLFDVANATSVQMVSLQKIEKLVKRILVLSNNKKSISTAPAAAKRERVIAAMDRQIDSEVYKLYGLDSAQIQAVEDATR